MMEKIVRSSEHWARRAALAGSFAFAALLAPPPGPVMAGSAAPAKTATAVLAGGCFWGMEAVFQSLRGVGEVTSGYAGGSKETATYERVSTGTTGHAESVQIHFDPARISYRTLLDVYFSVAHDPTERDRQGPDAGSQYRSVIFYANDGQRREAVRAIAAWKAKFTAPIVTEVVPLRAFYPAEAYHQRFAERNPDYPYIVEVDAPKLVALRRQYGSLVKP